LFINYRGKTEKNKTFIPIPWLDEFEDDDLFDGDNNDGGGGGNQGNI